MSKVLSISAMVLILILSFLLDRGYSLLRQAGAEQLGSGFSVSDALRPMLIGEIFANLVFILALWISLAVAL